MPLSLCLIVKKLVQSGCFHLHNVTIQLVAEKLNN